MKEKFATLEKNENWNGLNATDSEVNSFQQEKIEVSSDSLDIKQA